METRCIVRDYERLGLKKEIQLFEDGVRTSGRRGEYEWWYFDTKLKGGASLVIVFFTAPITSFSGGFKPYVILDLVTPDGKGEIHTAYYPKKGDYYFSKAQCDVKIGDCRIKGDLNEYEIYFKNEAVEVSVSLKGSVPSWRPYTGQIYFNERDYFAWLPSVPEGKVNAVVKCGEDEIEYEGTGYHDHNWGNKLMFFLMHHWYWGRAKIGDYVVVSAFITADKKRGFFETPVFMLAKDGKHIADDAYRCLKYTESDYEWDEKTKKHFAKTLVYDYEDGDERYVITYKKEESVERMGMETQLKRWQYPIVWLMGLRGSYHRVGGTATLERYVKGELVERVSSPAIWEQMYFGKDRLR